MRKSIRIEKTWFLGAPDGDGECKDWSDRRKTAHAIVTFTTKPKISKSDWQATATYITCKAALKLSCKCARLQFYIPFVGRRTVHSSYKWEPTFDQKLPWFARNPLGLEAVVMKVRAYVPEDIRAEYDFFDNSYDQMENHFDITPADALEVVLQPGSGLANIGTKVLAGQVVGAGRETAMGDFVNIQADAPARITDPKLADDFCFGLQAWLSWPEDGK